MSRDLSKFPADDNGNVLWEFHKRGFELGTERNVRFALLFPEHDAALKFGVFLLRHSYWVQVNEIEDKPGYKAEVLVDICLETNHKEISEAEQWLAKNSASIGGKNDGWEIQSATPALVGSEFVEVSSS